MEMGSGLNERRFGRPSIICCGLSCLFVLTQGARTQLRWQSLLLLVHEDICKDRNEIQNRYNM